jgi:hypothetical protein
MLAKGFADIAIVDSAQGGKGVYAIWIRPTLFKQRPRRSEWGWLANRFSLENRCALSD